MNIVAPRDMRMGIALEASTLQGEDSPQAAEFRRVRGRTLLLCEPLEIEDYVIQSMPDVSPTKWHLAHTTWFFETFLLLPQVSRYTVFHPDFGHLFNSYYLSVGKPFSRPRRGLLARPTVRQVIAYREHVDRAMEQLLRRPRRDLQPLLALGLNHEQQHQELMLTDLKHVFGTNPLLPPYRDDGPGGAPLPEAGVPLPLRWVEHEEGIHAIGHEGAGFAFDSEGPRHRELVASFRIGSRLVTNGEFREFITAGGYRRPELWLSDGWDAVQRHRWQAPLHWHEREGRWHEYTLRGLRPCAPQAPVCHVSFYEADAYARWAGARLPTEQEWEVAAAPLPVAGNFQEGGQLHPQPVGADGGELMQMFGDLWEWTSSPYAPYPGYRPAAGALGEYNGKFMCNQMVLGGGSCATPHGHVRPTYRNFFAPASRWQFTGIRLAGERSERG
jgi:ergothioneine biosynthesis protein EgtB